MFRLIMVCLIALSAAAAEAKTWYAAPWGKASNPGTKSGPFSLAAALDGRHVRAGDRLYLRGGTYRGRFTSALAGTSSHPIGVRAYPAERARIDGSLKVLGRYAQFRNIEVMSSNRDRTHSNGIGIDCRGPGTRIINCLVHDCGQGIVMRASAISAWVYGCVIYRNGWQASGTPVGSGQGILVENLTGYKRISTNIIFDQYGFGVATGASAKGVVITRNIIFDSGAKAAYFRRRNNIRIGGGASRAERITITQNSTYHASARDGENVTIAGAVTSPALLFCQYNYFAGGNLAANVVGWRTIYFDYNTIWGKNVLVRLDRSGGVTPYWDHNEYIEGLVTTPFSFDEGFLSFDGWKSATGFDAASTYTTTATHRPTGVAVQLYPNAIEPARIHMAIYNWDRTPSVRVDLNGYLRSGQAFKIYSVYSLFTNPLVSAVYRGRPITVPMNRMRPGPEFGAFMLVKY